MAPQRKKIGLVDDSFRHYPVSSVLGETPQFFEWDRNTPYDNDLVVFTNENILSAERAKVPHEKRIAWLQESRGVLGFLYESVAPVIQDYPLFLTHDSQLLKTHQNCAFLPGGGIYIGNRFGGGVAEIGRKQTLCSVVSSFKNTTPAHEIRNRIAKRVSTLNDPQFQVFGGSPYLFDYIPIHRTLDEFMFSIVVENTIDDFYFTEKLLNCFSSGTIPIYLGAQKIERFFDIEGIIQIHSLRELFSRILPNLSSDLYISMFEHVKINFLKAQQYRCTEDYVWNHYLA